MLSLQKYLNKHAITRPITNYPNHPIKHAIIIPAYQELHSLPKTLQSLEKCPQNHHTLILIIINNPTLPTDHPAYTQNQTLLTKLPKIAQNSKHHIAWIDASTHPKQIPNKTGVGMARKIACDSLIKNIQQNTPQNNWAKSVILHLDADTLVQPNYQTTINHLLNQKYSAGVIPFHHQTSPNPQIQTAINQYQQYLHYYVNALKYAQSPYAYHTIGSTMISTIQAYIQAGGIPAKRTAGEDFYFLQQLAKITPILSNFPTIVYPSPRPSNRVPFGTGPTIKQTINQNTPYLTYHPQTFQQLKQLLHTIKTNLQKTDTEIITKIHNTQTKQFLTNKKFPQIWQKLQQQNKTPQKIQQAFHIWFDALTTLRLINHLTQTQFPKIPLQKAINILQKIKTKSVYTQE